MTKPGNMTGKLHTMKFGISFFLILMILPVALIGQATVKANVSATITGFELIEQVPDSIDLRFKVGGTSNFLMNLTVKNTKGTSSNDIIVSPSTEFILPGKKVPGRVIIFNYN